MISIKQAIKEALEMQRVNPEYSVFQVLSCIDVKNVEGLVSLNKEVNGFSYISWADAYVLVKSIYPDTSFKYIRTPDGKLYDYDSTLGYMVTTEVTIQNQSQSCFMFARDKKNKALKEKSYTYKTKNGENGVLAADMGDINTALMRCLAKNLALFGLGISLFTGEDLELFLSNEDLTNKSKTTNKQQTIPPKPSIPSITQINNTSNAIRANSPVSTTTYNSDKSKLETELRNKIISCYKTSYKKTFEPVVQSIDPTSKSELMGLGKGESYTMSIPLEKIQHYWNLLEGINNGK
jgi:hypothetical protein